MPECATLHRFARTLPRHRVPFDAGAMPKSGLYLLFEKGEESHGGERLVRVGTHTGEAQLLSRLQQHFVAQNKDRSIFRKNIGRALLSKAKDPFVEWWERDLTSAVARKKWEAGLDKARQKRVEDAVTQYMREHFSFAVLAVADMVERLRWESKMISTLSLCEECVPSAQWLGNYSPKQKIRESGLWLVNELYKTPLTTQELGTLERL